ncbi:MAG: Asp-tRNA(Asn)/Glu-tRNA(Gln) amidotransferase subunit GatC [Anaerolineales bacterium]|jgi:aspartyl-tRNA(Asn)/glutamyl-tRNA(Gln) amidotransferase subunit C
MSLTLEEVEYIAELARLSLRPEEKEIYRDQLSKILDYASRLGNLDTTLVPATFSVVPYHTALRPDHSRPGIGEKKLLLNAPLTEEGQFKVPPILD